MAEKILVIDDDLDSLKLIGLLLQRYGYQVSTARGGTEGLAKARKDQPDLIVLDIMMPTMDGYEVCRRLRSVPRLSMIPILMFTARTRVDDKAAGFDAGADDYLTKPTHPAELASRVKALLARQTKSNGESSGQFGKVIAVAGIRGGSGVSSTAVNLSTALIEQQKDTILVDLLYRRGSIGLMLGFPAVDGLSPLLQCNPDDLDQESVERELISLDSGLQLLLTSYYPEKTIQDPRPGQIEHIVDLLAQSASYIVLDVGSAGGSSILQSAMLADHVVLCLPPGTTSIAMAKTMLRHLEKVNIAGDRLSIVSVNTFPTGLAADKEIIEEQLGHPILTSIPADPRIATQSAEHHSPMMSIDPESKVADCFRLLASQIITSLAKPIQESNGPDGR